MCAFKGAGRHGIRQQGPRPVSLEMVAKLDLEGQEGMCIPGEWLSEGRDHAGNRAPKKICAFQKPRTVY